MSSKFCEYFKQVKDFFSDGQGQLTLQYMVGSGRIFHCKSMGNFSGAQGQLTPQCMVRLGLITDSLYIDLLCPRLNLECSPDLNVVLVTCKNEEDSIKNEGAPMFTTLYFFFRRPRAAYSVICGWILPIFELTQAFLHVLVPCKNK